MDLRKEIQTGVRGKGGEKGKLHTLRTSPRIHGDATDAEMAGRMEAHAALGVGVETLQVVGALGVAKVIGIVVIVAFVDDADDLAGT